MLARRAHPPQPPRSLPASLGSTASRRARCARACVWLLALSVALQGSAMAMTRASAPAHFHTAVSPSQTPGFTADSAPDPMLDLVRVVQNHHGSAPHRHSAVERHEHEAGADNVVYLDDDAAGADAVKSPAGKRAAADLDTPIVTVSVANLEAPFRAIDVAPRCAYESHIGARLERPPR